MKPKKNQLHEFCSTLARLAVALIIVSPAWINQDVYATPYAAQVVRQGDTVSFTLNEAADSVQVVFDGGASTTDLGALPAGTHTFNTGGAASFEIRVRKNSPPGYLQGEGLVISGDTTLTRFNSPRGVTVNRDPSSPHFGRVYISNSEAGSATGGERALGDGIYVLNADLSDAFGQGDTARTAGLDFAGGDKTPYRLSVGEDNNLYVSDWSNTTGSLYVTDPNVTDGSGQNVLGGPVTTSDSLSAEALHGSISAAVVEGSLANGNLTAYVIDEDLGSARNSLWKHTIGAALPSTEFPEFISSQGITFVGQTMDMERGPDGKFYITDYRFAGTDVGGLYVVDSDGTMLFNSLEETRTLQGDPSAPDIMRLSGGVAVSEQGDFVAVINYSNNTISVLPLTDGIPDLTQRKVITAFPSATSVGRDVHFDAAGNIYAISSGNQLLRVISPGGETLAVTTSDGTFSLTRIAPEIVLTVEVLDDTAAETGGDTASFRIVRAGNLSVAVEVPLEITGTAESGVDYQALPASVTVPAGATEVQVVLTPLDDADAEVTETVTLTLKPGDGYAVQVPADGTVFIRDTETPVVTITATDAATYERIETDVARFRLARTGDTNTSITVNLTIGGTATAGTDYQTIAASFELAAGLAADSFSVAPIDDKLVEEEETITVTLAGGAGYVAGSPDSAVAIISDDDLPEAEVLFSETFDSQASASNWNILSGGRNDVMDHETLFGYNYANDLIGPAPRTTDGSTTGLLVTVNKNDGLGSAAGINLYPIGQTFSGNYALRYDMMLVNGGGSGTTEHALSGINHSGTETNWVSLSTSGGNASNGGATTTGVPGGDGIWFAVVSDGSRFRSYAAYTSTNDTENPTLLDFEFAANTRSLFPNPPYSSPTTGSPANSYSAETLTWADVEVSQVGDVITLKINGNTILQFDNSTGYTSGNIMLGYNDAFASIGSGNNFVIYDNVRVVRLEEPALGDITITDIEVSESAVSIEFTAVGGAASGFTLASAPSVDGEYTIETGAQIEMVSPGVYRATTVPIGDSRFYRIQR